MIISSNVGAHKTEYSFHSAALDVPQIERWYCEQIEPEPASAMKQNADKTT